MKIKDRIKGLRRVKASELRPHAKNWRVHSSAQQEALRGILAEVGYVDALIARELKDGTLELIDGHLRAEATPDTKVPVLVVDLSDKEADKVLASLDPIAAMAERDQAKFDELLGDIKTNSEALTAMFQQMTSKTAEALAPTDSNLSMRTLKQVIAARSVATSGVALPVVRILKTKTKNKPPYRVPSMAEIANVKPNGFRVISSLSGCGGSSLGYKMAGFLVAWANEFIKAAQETYRTNHPKTILDVRDIRKIKSEEILKAIKMKAGQLDLFDGSPPCASFSTAGNRNEDWGKAKK